MSKADRGKKSRLRKLPAMDPGPTFDSTPLILECIKVPFDSECEAMRSLPARSRSKYPYKCHLCGKWHLTSHKTGKRRTP